MYHLFAPLESKWANLASYIGFMVKYNILHSHSFIWLTLLTSKLGGLNSKPSDQNLNYVVHNTQKTHYSLPEVFTVFTSQLLHIRFTVHLLAILRPL